MAASREFVIDAFMKYLGRRPESEESVAAHMSLDNEEVVVKVLTESKEYFDKLGATLHFSADVSSKFLLLGNCQLTVMGKLIEAMSSHASAVSIELNPRNTTGIQSGKFDLSRLVDEADYVVLQHLPTEPFSSVLNQLYPRIQAKIRLIPGISYSGFHPDMGYIRKASGAHLGGPMGEYHSMLVFWAWTNRLTVDQTLELFDDKIFKFLGYFDHHAASVEFLVDRGSHTDTPIRSLLSSWSSKGCFMHSLNHPKITVLGDLARLILQREGVEYCLDIEQYIADDLADHPCWPIYPAVAALFGLEGGYEFKQARHLGNARRPVPILGLESFIKASFEQYDISANSGLTCFRLDSEAFKNLRSFLSTVRTDAERSAAPTKQVNPYAGLENYQFWRRAIESVPSSEVDPVVTSKFGITKSDRVATAGSCFAQHISRTLSRNGFNYYVTETGASISQDAEFLKEQNYSVFSARYGNIYTARQLLQLFDRCYGNFTPLDEGWKRKDGRLVDPFRPLVQPSGFASVEEINDERQLHFASVREMFENMTVFVFTLGLTESWRSKADGAVFPLAPGVAAGYMDPNKYEFVNFETHDIVKDIEAFLSRLETINPFCKVILTVSPVPLVATYENRHVLTSTTYSKSALRSAADYIVRRYPQCEYFPSYEIITGNYIRSAYYEPDLRSVRDEGVAHVMRLFMEHYSSALDMRARPEVDKLLVSEAAMNNSIVCDEEALDAE
jgi:hypothetical protein